MSRYFTPKEYLHVQTEPSSIWTINHTCGNPSVDIFINENGKIEKIMPFSVIVVNDHQCEVHFTRPFAGTAKLVG